LGISHWEGVPNYIINNFPSSEKHLRRAWDVHFMEGVRLSTCARSKKNNPFMCLNHGFNMLKQWKKHLKYPENNSCWCFFRFCLFNIFADGLDSCLRCPLRPEKATTISWPLLDVLHTRSYYIVYLSKLRYISILCNGILCQYIYILWCQYIMSWCYYIF
jgi:hypothetical protein